MVESAVGVPEISPVAMSKLNPAGRSGLTEYPYTFAEESIDTSLRLSFVVS